MTPNMHNRERDRERWRRMRGYTVGRGGEVASEAYWRVLEAVSILGGKQTDPDMQRLARYVLLKVQRKVGRAETVNAPIDRPRQSMTGAGL